MGENSKLDWTSAVNGTPCDLDVEALGAPVDGGAAELDGRLLVDTGELVSGGNEDMVGRGWALPAAAVTMFDIVAVSVWTATLGAGAPAGHMSARLMRRITWRDVPLPPTSSQADN